MAGSTSTVSSTNIYKSSMPTKSTGTGTPSVKGALIIINNRLTNIPAGQVQLGRPIAYDVNNIPREKTTSQARKVIIDGEFKGYIYYENFDLRGTASVNRGLRDANGTFAGTINQYMNTVIDLPDGRKAYCDPNTNNIVSKGNVAILGSYTKDAHGKVATVTIDGKKCVITNEKYGTIFSGYDSKLDEPAGDVVGYIKW